MTVPSTKHIDLYFWAKDEASLDKVAMSPAFGLAKMVDGEIQWDRDVTGQQKPGGGWQPYAIPDKSSAPVMSEDDPTVQIGWAENLPGVFYTLRAVYRPAKPHRGYVSLAERLRMAISTEDGSLILDEGGNLTYYPTHHTVTDPETGEDVQEELPIAYQISIPTRVRLAGGAIQTEAGAPVDPNMPRHLDVKDPDSEEIIVRIIDPRDVKTPVNTF